MGFFRRQMVLPNERKAVTDGSPFIVIKPCRLLLDELPPPAELIFDSSTVQVYTPFL